MRYAAIVYSHKNVDESKLYEYDIEDRMLNDYACEYVILRTCNRIELYIASENAEKDIKNILGALINDSVKYKKGEIYTGREMVKHLFSVASGLESMLIGENEILGQVRTIHDEYAKTKRAGSFLSPLLRSAINTGKKVRTETEIGKGKTGIYSLAVDYLRRYADKEIGIVGAGSEASRFLNGFSAGGKIGGKVFSRNPDNARKLAEKYSLDYGIFNEEEIKEYGVIFCAYKGKQKVTVDDKTLVVDISVPRIFSGKNVVYLEDLVKTSSSNKVKREGEAVKARYIVENAVDEFIRRN
jgi:glutamyl-tRNA reductase